MKVLDLFSGIGGISLGLHRTGGFRTVAFCEIDPVCREVLRARFPGVPVHDDVRQLGGDTIGPVRLIAGGFPCQDISVAGKGAGIDGHRSGLWAEMHRLVRELRPDWVLVENVLALRTRGADRVLGDLEAEGYAGWPLVVGARHVGAPHRRDRAWIVAHRHSRRLEGVGVEDDSDEQRASGHQPDGCGGPRTDDQRHGTAPLAVPASARREESRREHRGALASVAPHPWPAGPGQPQHAWEPPRVIARAQSGMGGDAHGLPARLVSRERRAALRALGNSVVPQVVEAIGRAILAADHQLQSPRPQAAG